MVSCGFDGGPVSTAPSRAGTDAVVHTFPSMKPALRLAALLFPLAVACSAQTLLHEWRFGESEAGAEDGGSVTTINDDVGKFDLVASGTVTYTSGTPGNASSLAAAFDSSGSFLSPADGSLAADASFIIEGWVRLDGATSPGSKFLFYNGNASWSGIGLMVNGTNVEVLEGGKFAATAGSLSVNQWNYVALAYFNGGIQVFVNGATTPAFTDTSAFNDYAVAEDNGQTNTFAIGGSFAGAFDEVRVSSFTGSFDPSMLSYSAISAVPEPSTYAGLAGLAALGFVAWRRRMSRA